MKKIVLISLIIFSCSFILLGCEHLNKVIQPSISQTTEDTNKIDSKTSDKSTINQNSSDDKQPETSENTKKNVISNTSSNKNSNSKTDQLLNNINIKAQNGEVINYNFQLGNLIDNIISELGTPSNKNYVAAAKGEYFTFENYNLSFGCNKGNEIFEIRSLDESLYNLNINIVENFFGKPSYNVKTKSNETIIGYKINTNFKLLFVFDTTNSKLKHYSVLYPRLTKNSMSGDDGRDW